VHFLVAFAVGLAPFVFAGLFGGGNALLLSGAVGKLAVCLYFPSYWRLPVLVMYEAFIGGGLSIWSFFRNGHNIVCGKSQKNHLKDKCFIAPDRDTALIGHYGGMFLTQKVEIVSERLLGGFLW
jgi:hypothetical protein